MLRSTHPSWEMRTKIYGARRPNRPGYLGTFLSSSTALHLLPWNLLSCWIKISAHTYKRTSFLHYQHPAPEWYICYNQRPHNDTSLSPTVYIRVYSWCCTFYPISHVISACAGTSSVHDSHVTLQALITWLIKSRSRDWATPSNPMDCSPPGSSSMGPWVLGFVQKAP